MSQKKTLPESSMKENELIEPLWKKIAAEFNPEDLDPTFSYKSSTMTKIALPDATSKEIGYNLPYNIMYQPIYGPKNPFEHRQLAMGHSIGYCEADAIHDADFEEQRRTFHKMGYALDPSLHAMGSRQYVGDVSKAHQLNGASAHDYQKELSLVNSDKRKRLPKGDPKGEYAGPWAGYEEESIIEPEGPTEEELSRVQKQEEERVKGRVYEKTKETTIFHGASERDYLGRTYLHVPRDVDIDLTAEEPRQAYTPKVRIHTWGDEKSPGVNAIRFLPKSGHLLLSAQVDGKVKIYDVYHDRRCLRTYIGHEKSVRNITFSNDGRRFLTCSLDRYVKLWDTETGKCIGAYTNNKTPHCVTFNPDDDKQNIILAGCSDKKIIQWDTNTGEIVQEYNEHLGSVNTITFFDDNRRFVTTSDDKTLRVWEFGIPVQIKYIADPSMHSMPAVALHPNQKWMACQSLDNVIYVYSARDRFRLNPKKRFTGHLVAGNACNISFSSDGRFLMSGDSDGRMFFWDWKTSKIFKTFKAHNKVVIDCQWHPQEQSKVATASWDGTIKYWD